MTMIQKLKKSKKGFTLVELLVVLVIIAILAAAIVPSMLGFIDKAKKESAAAECRNVLLAADVELNEEYGLGTLSGSTIDTAAVASTADVPGTINSITVATDANNHPYVDSISYTASNGTTYTYSSATGNWS